LDDFVTKTWAPTHGVTLAPKTRKHYALLYDHHIAPTLGLLQLRAIRAETISRWQADRLAAGAGPVAVRQALDLLGSVLQRAVESERIAANPVRLVRRARLPRRKEVRPLAPSDVERMRAAASQRDATLFSPTPAFGPARRSRSSGRTSGRKPKVRSLTSRSARRLTVSANCLSTKS
jgi:hypothetical protein